MPTAKIEILGPDIPPERLFSVAFFFLRVSAGTTSFTVFTVFNPRYTQSQSTLTIREHVCVSQSYAICLISVLHLTAPSDPSFDFSPPSHSSRFDHSTQTISWLWGGIRKRTNKKCMQVENPRDTWCGDGGVPKSEFTEWNSPEPVKHCIIMFKWQ